MATHATAPGAGSRLLSSVAQRLRDTEHIHSSRYRPPAQGLVQGRVPFGDSCRWTSALVSHTPVTKTHDDAVARMILQSGGVKSGLFQGQVLTFTLLTEAT